MKYQVGGAVSASTYIGVFEANSPEEAIERAYDAASVSVCHQCAAKIDDPEIAHLWAEDESGNVTSEPSEHDKLVEAHNRLADASAWVARLEKVLGEQLGMRDILGSDDLLECVERNLKSQRINTRSLWAMRVLDAWAAKHSCDPFKTHPYQAGTEWHCVSAYECRRFTADSADAARLAAATALVAADPSLDGEA